MDCNSINGNETSGSLKGGEFCEYLSDCQVLKEDSAPCEFVS
jgi:hypothetical protein